MPARRLVPSAVARNPLASHNVGGCAYHQSWRLKLDCWLGSAKYRVQPAAKGIAAALVIAAAIACLTVRAPSGLRELCGGSAVWR